MDSQRRASPSRAPARTCGLGAAVLLLAVVASCSSPAGSEPDPEPAPSWAEAPGSATPVESSVPRAIDELHVDWSAVGPLDLLDELRRRAGGGVFTVWERPPADWFARDDVERLVALVRSEEPACSVVSSLSSMLPIEQDPDGGVRMRDSTVGREAAFLVEGFRAGRYPPSLSSLAYFEPDPAELERWWRERAANER